MDVTPILAPLNDAQRAAVTAPPGHLLVLAGAGSGKTTCGDLAACIITKLSVLVNLDATQRGRCDQCKRRMREDVSADHCTNSLSLSPSHGHGRRLRAIAIDGGDLIQWDGTTATMIFDSSDHFDGQGNVYESADAEIDAIHVTDFDIVGGTIVLNEIVVSTGGDVKDVNGDVLFGPEDLFTFDLGTDTATAFFDAGTDINAFSRADILDLSDLLVTVDENNGIAEPGEFNPNGDPGTDPDADIDNFVRIQSDATGADILVDADGTVGGENFVSAGYVPDLAAGDLINVIIDDLGNSEAVMVI